MFCNYEFGRHSTLLVIICSPSPNLHILQSYIFVLILTLQYLVWQYCLTLLDIIITHTCWNTIKVRNKETIEIFKTVPDRSIISYWPEQFRSRISYWPEQFWSIISYWPKLFWSIIPYWPGPSHMSIGAGWPCLWVLAFCAVCWHAVQ